MTISMLLELPFVCYEKLIYIYALSWQDNSRYENSSAVVRFRCDDIAQGNERKTVN